MSLPPELQYNIISFIPFSSTPYCRSVCKEWGKEINSIQKKYVDVISNWYWKRRIGFDFKTTNEHIRYLILDYFHKDFIILPEKIVSILGLHMGLVNVVRPKNTRKRSDVKDWMMNLPLDVEDWKYVVGSII